MPFFAYIQLEFEDASMNEPNPEMFLALITFEKVRVTSFLIFLKFQNLIIKLRMEMGNVSKR